MLDPDGAIANAPLPSGARLIRGQTLAEEQESVKDLRKWLSFIPQIVDDRDRILEAHAQPRAELSADDAITNPYQLSHMIAYCQNMAVDSLRALHTLLDPKGDGNLDIPIFAQYPLIRTVMEASAQALWIIGPDEQQERVRRLLRARRSEILFDMQLVASRAAEHPEDSREVRSEKQRIIREAARKKRNRVRHLASIAAASGINLAEYEKGHPGYAAIVEEAAPYAQVPAWIARLYWQSISGLTHPSTSRGSSMSELLETGPMTGNIYSTRMTADISQINAALTIALKLYKSAEDQLRVRMLRPHGR